MESSEERVRVIRSDIFQHIHGRTFASISEQGVSIVK